MDLVPILRFVFHQKITAVDAFSAAFLHQLITRHFMVSLDKLTPSKRRFLYSQMRSEAENFRRSVPEITPIDLLQNLQQCLYFFIMILEDQTEQDEQLFEIYDDQDEGFIDTEKTTWHHPEDQ